MAAQGEDAYFTLLLNDSYLPGTEKKLAIMVTLDNIQASTVTELKKLYDYIVPVERIVNRNAANLYLMNRGDLVSTFTKINLWQQQRFRKIVYLDADVVVLRAPDELFDIENDFAAAPDVGWPDCFNSGVLVLKPSMGEYYSLLALAQRGISFDGADQGLLNTHFPNYHRISFAYNCTPSAHYQYVPAYRHFQSSIATLHFIGPEKPWIQGRDVSSNFSVYNELLGRWWAVYDKHYRDTAVTRIGQSPWSEFRTVQESVEGKDKGDKRTEHVEPHSTTRSEPPMYEQSQLLERIEGADSPSTNISSVTEFSAPFAEWDPARSAPPPGSRPEAANFPHMNYEMSRETQLFKTPSYPDPPKEAEITAQKSPAQPLKPIFPWEISAPAPTRVFADDHPPPSPSKSTSSAPSGTDEETQADETSPTTPTTQIASPQGWKTFTASNAWDEIPEIDRYMSSIAQSRKGRVQLLHNPLEGAEEVLSPSERRASVKVTDFPTEIERPSLPVTPAPIRRPSFWGSERDDNGDLPAAEGVPKQADWNPSNQLEELLRRQSEFIPHMVTATDATSTSHEIPDRKLLESGSTVPVASALAERRASVNRRASQPSTETSQATPQAGGAPDHALSRLPESSSRPDQALDMS
ncbi:MAG: glycogenin glucosyltransferase [Piccolia ochrophora]|nr:MAG: glycogenin glucosyltransferase [Piccolia ochrophora]